MERVEASSRIIDAMMREIGRELFLGAAVSHVSGEPPRGGGWREDVGRAGWVEGWEALLQPQRAVCAWSGLTAGCTSARPPPPTSCADEALDSGSQAAAVVGQVVEQHLEQLDETFLATLDACIQGALGSSSSGGGGQEAQGAAEIAGV